MASHTPDDAASTYRNIAKNASLLSLSVGATMVISLAFKMLLPRILGPEQIGLFFYAESLTGVIFAFLPLGLATYINRVIPGNPAQLPKVFTSLLLLELLMAICLGSGLLLYVFWGKVSPELWGLMLCMGLYAAFYHFQRSILHTIFIALEQVQLISILNVAIKLFLVTGCLLVLWQAPSVLSVALIHSLAEWIGLSLLLWLCWRRGYWQNRPSLETMKSLLAVSLPFYLAGVLTKLFTEVDMNMLGKFSTPAEAGYFGAANKLMGVFMLLVPILQNAFTPPLSRALEQSPESFDRLLKQLLQILLLLSLPLTFLLLLFGADFSRLLYGSGFQPSLKIVCFLTPVLTMMYINTFTGASLYLCGSGQKLSLVFVLGIIVNVILDAYAIPIGHRLGPGGAGLAVSFCTFLCELFVFAAMLRIFPRKIIDWRLIKNIFFILLPCWLAMWYYEELQALSFGQRLGLALLCPIYAHLTGLLSPEERRYIGQQLLIIWSKWHRKT